MDILAYWVERYPQMLESEEDENAERGEPGDEGVGEREDEDGAGVDHEHQGNSDDA